MKDLGITRKHHSEFLKKTNLNDTLPSPAWSETLKISTWERKSMGDRKRSSGHDLAIWDISVGSRQRPGNVVPIHTAILPTIHLVQSALICNQILEWFCLTQNVIHVCAYTHVHTHTCVVLCTYNSPSLYRVSLSAFSVTLSQLWSENIIWKIPEVSKS